MRKSFGIRQFASQICVNRSLLFWVFVFYANMASAAELKIWVKAFIPKYHATNEGYVVSRPGHSGEFMIPDPIQLGVCFATDDRAFSSDPAASARMTSMITLVYTGDKISKYEVHRTDETREYSCADGVEKQPPKSASTSRMHWGTPAQADGSLQVTLEGNANNPLVAGSPSIYYAGDFIFTPHSKILRYRLTLGRFPAFEAYAQLDGGRIVTLFTEEPAEGSDVWSLISVGGVGTRNVSGEVDL